MSYKKYKFARAPHLRHSDKPSTMCADVLVALAPLCIFSAVYYGLRPVLLVLTGLGSAVLCETIGCLIMRRKPTVLDGSAAVTGAIIGLLVSPISPYWVPAAGAAFAILVVKMPMGGSGRNVFNPAAAGLSAVTLCFPGFFFRYPDPGTGLPLPLSNTVNVAAVPSPVSQLASGGKTLYSPMTLLLGGFPGPIGATAIIILIACALYLLIRRTISPHITLPYLAVCAALAYLFPRVTAGAAGSVMVELCSGYLLFCGIFILNDPVTAPRHWLGRIGYGVLAGVLVMLTRYFGRFEEGACFAVLLANAFATTLDRLGWYALNLRSIRRRRQS